jgi:hypothetical protein
MDKRVIYKNPDGSVSIIIPAPDCGLTLEQIAAKDVPTGARYKIVDVAMIPSRANRATFTIPDAALTDGVGADYGVGSENEVIGYRPDGAPIVRRRGAGK